MNENIHIFFIRFFFHSMICCHYTVGMKYRQSSIVYGNKGIYIDYLGRAYCYWTEGTGSKKEAHTASEIYLEQRQYLLGGRTGM